MSARRTPSPPSMTILWAMTGTVIGVLLLAVAMNDLTLTYAALALTAVYAVIGMAYGLWDARDAARRHQAEATGLERAPRVYGRHRAASPRARRD